MKKTRGVLWVYSIYLVATEDKKTMKSSTIMIRVDDDAPLCGFVYKGLGTQALKCQQSPASRIVTSSIRHWGIRIINSRTNILRNFILITAFT